MSKKTRTNLIKGFISIAFFVFLASFIKGNELLAVFLNTNWFFFSLSFLLVPVMLVSSCMKWKLLLDSKERIIPFSRLINIYLIGYLFSNLLPSTVGGDVARSYYAGKEINDQSYAAVTVFVERFSGVIFLLILVILAPLAKPSLYGNIYLLLPAICSVVLLLLFIYAWKAKKSILAQQTIKTSLSKGFDRISSRTRSIFIKKCISFFEGFLNRLFSRIEHFSLELSKALHVIRHDKIFFLKIALLTVIFYFLTWVNVFIAFLAFGREVDFLAVVALVPTILFVAHFPVTLLGNLGFFESVFVFYFLLIGVPGEETLAMGLLLRLKMLCLGGLGFVVYLLFKQSWGAPPVVNS